MVFTLVPFKREESKCCTNLPFLQELEEIIIDSVILNFFLGEADSGTQSLKPYDPLLLVKRTCTIGAQPLITWTSLSK